VSALPAPVRRGGARGPRGFAVLTALFLVVVLAALAVYLTALFAYGQSAAALDVAGARALAAARAGTESGLYRSLRMAQCPALTTLTFAGSTLAPYTVTVACTRTTVLEAGVNVNVDRIVATACNQPDPACPRAAAPGAGYVERQYQVTVAQP
jgi:MSHA biogenesis protein MshP